MVQAFVIGNFRAGQRIEGSARDAHKRRMEFAARLASGDYVQDDELQASFRANPGQRVFEIIETPAQRQQQALLNAKLGPALDRG